jgi:hypothetical protein
MTTSFQRDILPLFTQTDIDHMSQFGVILNDYSYMEAYAKRVLKEFSVLACRYS